MSKGFIDGWDSTKAMMRADARKRKECPECKGWGEDANTYPCVICGGSGFVEDKKEITPGNHMTTKSICPECKGAGK